MAKFDMTDTKALQQAVAKYLNELPGKLICALQLWYEGLSGHGAPNPAEMAAMEAALSKVEGWEPAGDVRYEKFGTQKSFKRVK